MSLREIMDEQPRVTEKKSFMSRVNDRVEHTLEKKDLRPIVIFGLVIVYSITVVIGATTIVILNFSGNNVASECISNGGEWVIGNDGERECVHTKK